MTARRRTAKPSGTPMISAQVVLRSASGRLPAENVSADTVAQLAPSEEAAARAMTAFRQAGFEVGRLVANNFSITAPPKTFEGFFKRRVRPREPSGKASDRPDDASYELSLDALPRDLASAIEAVTFTPPPDFGPTNY